MRKFIKKLRKKSKVHLKKKFYDYYENTVHLYKEKFFTIFTKIQYTNTFTDMAGLP